MNALQVAYGPGDSAISKPAYYLLSGDDSSTSLLQLAECAAIRWQFQVVLSVHFRAVYFVLHAVW